MTNKENELKENIQEAGSVEIEVFTDPLCCWSWAFEPQWRRLRYEYSGKIRWRYRMGGLIPNWDTYNDPMNSISKPLQMGPLWMEVKHKSGMPLNDRIWVENPPKSSYPSCIAVKAAEMQSPIAAEQYLRRIREAIMLHGRNIGEREVLLEVAKQLAVEKPQILNYSTFEQDFGGDAAPKAFEEDLKDVRMHNISRFPSLAIRKSGQNGVLIVGYRPYEVLVQALEQVAPALEPTQHATDEDSYKQFWGGALDKEVEEALKPEMQAGGTA
ncbi:putative DsbA family dithiol-disulfide isomerase [Pontibacter ummariensis]|uniref:Predicted dithiol-disulfide isomerase, DsbA family n=1 Tax=Pontibacter ummariensis TaxID=1610492 RepID=A0A239L4Q4_9BACT|nr:DsbA family protein [Pontibacter ummariensis]PRY04265.1 putative DsbA family dithiol-disulfide isomerase [Pontibacter ummariensis]SNT25421.1 Predicted dithiol-disulfide isomerase, DsbA family [Pontibacter ummariensis]